MKILVTHPKPGQSIPTACGRGRIVFMGDCDTHNYLLIWNGEARQRLPDFYRAVQVMLLFGATFNSDNAEWI